MSRKAYGFRPTEFATYGSVLDIWECGFSSDIHSIGWLFLTHSIVSSTLIPIIQSLLTRAFYRLFPGVHANGGVNTKQSIGIYGSATSPNPWGERNDSALQKAILRDSLPELVINATGRLTVETYSVDFDRQGKPAKGLVMGKLENDGRAIAFIDTSNGILKRFEEIDFDGLNG